MTPRTVRVSCLAKPHPLEMNLAVEVLDLSDTGAKLLLRKPLTIGSQVFVSIRAAANGYGVDRSATVAWCTPPSASGTAEAGVRFAEPLRYADLHQLARI